MRVYQIFHFDTHHKVYTSSLPRIILLLNKSFPYWAIENRNNRERENFGFV